DQSRGECELKHQPDVLVIMLKRFEYDDRLMRNIKNNREVDVPYTLYMPQVEYNVSIGFTYELYASVEHFGELGFGHYIARIRSQDDGRWYIFDDLNVSVVSLNISCFMIITHTT
uniref:USP domain-containing protein n=1 Tax=Neogobius melanostomus TaxID=47308 RepID=A0A8C6UCT9_9GOBI